MNVLRRPCKCGLRGCHSVVTVEWDKEAEVLDLKYNDNDVEGFTHWIHMDKELFNEFVKFGETYFPREKKVKPK
jgi:hypothetical protein